ncbi:unnamed protein product [Malus baccata var. baccata]
MYQLESGRGPLGVIEYTALLGRFEREKQKLRGQFEEYTSHYQKLRRNGCNAFDANGEVVYQVDNYDNKHIDEVNLMDLRGNLLLTVCENKIQACMGGTKESNRLLAIAEMAN